MSLIEPQEEVASSAAQEMVTTEYFSAVYSRGFFSTVRFLCSKGATEEAAFDTAQTAWTKGWEKRRQLRDIRFLVTWINSIALNSYRNEMIRGARMQPLEDLEGFGGLSSAPIEVERIFATCKATDRAVLENYYIKGYSLAELAAHRNCSEGAVRIVLFRARKRVRRALGLNLKEKPVTEHHNARPATFNRAMTSSKHAA